MPMDDLFKSLQMFSQGVKEYQLQSAIGQANDHVQQIKAADLNEQQKRSELQSLSNQLVGHLAGLGASGTQIQAAGMAVGPKQFATADQAMLEGTLTGNTDLAHFGEQADQMATANQVKLYKTKAAIDEAAQRRLFDHQEKIAAMKAGIEHKPSGDQFKAAGFAKRLLESDSVFNDLEAGGFDRSSAGSSMASMLPNRMQSADTQKQKQAERNFVNAQLRRESGAAISQSEFDSAELQYFPRSGDSAEVKKQKAANRMSVLQALKAESGDAWDRLNRTDPFAGAPAGSRAAATAPASSGAPAWANPKYIRR